MTTLFFQILIFKCSYLVDGGIDYHIACLDLINRKTLICAVNKDAEKSFKKTVEVDRLIDMLRDADDKEVSIFEFLSDLIYLLLWQVY